MRYTVRYQFGTYSGNHEVQAEDEDQAIAKTRAWVHAQTTLPMAYERYRIVARWSDGSAIEGG